MNRTRHIDIMGIVNLTDDSFYSDSRCTDTASALQRIESMLEEGATMIDIGACSTRPGSLPVCADEQWRRLKPVLSAMRDGFDGCRVSIDTEWADVTVRAYDLIGDFIVNDVSSGSTDQDMLPVVGRLGLDYVAMHRRGTPETMQNLVDYDDVVEAVVSFFTRFEKKAADNGLKNWIIDPGFGFAKTIEQNYELLARLGEVARPGHPMLVGVSRKSMIYKKFGIEPADALPATQVLHFRALQSGADILRVHDVAEAARTIELYRLLGEMCQ